MFLWNVKHTWTNLIGYEERFTVVYTHNNHSPRPMCMCVCACPRKHARAALMIMGNWSVRATSVLPKLIFSRLHVRTKRDWKIRLCFQLIVVLQVSFHLIVFLSCSGPRSKRRLSRAQLIKTPKRLERLHHEDDSCPQPVEVHHVTTVTPPIVSLPWQWWDPGASPAVMPSVHLVESKQWHNRKQT